ncbi:invasion associated locus B family protein [Brucella intermedia]|uniref:invasion associated locus B family protein n=1 Tax=Brucella intermedia TaxID=94625 RepID=UPI00046A4BF6|nr:invasion associated locus B family protein [Brucella intermedia]
MKKMTVSALMVAGILATGISSVAAPLPGGASTLQETYEDWTVSCQTADKNAVCAMRQVQSNSKTGQRVLLAELQKTAKGNEGVLLLPFGLELAKGATTKVDDTDGEALQFSTCLPQGCLMPVTFDDKQIASLKKSSSFKVQATSLNPAQPVDFAISLKGFGAAYDRMTALLQ